MFVVSIFVNIGMWFERFVIVISSLSRDFLPAAWAYYRPTWVDVSTFIGSFGLFMTLFLIFIRFLPMMAMAEIKGVMPAAHPRHGHDPAERRGPEVASPSLRPVGAPGRGREQ